jgi:hypothetical protein
MNIFFCSYCNVPIREDVTIHPDSDIIYPEGSVWEVCPICHTSFRFYNGVLTHIHIFTSQYYDDGYMISISLEADETIIYSSPQRERLLIFPMAMRNITPQNAIQKIRLLLIWA